MSMSLGFLTQFLHGHCLTAIIVLSIFEDCTVLKTVYCACSINTVLLVGVCQH